MLFTSFSHSPEFKDLLLFQEFSTSALCFPRSISFQCLVLSSSSSLAVCSLFPSFLYSHFHFLWNVLAFSAGFILPSPSAALVFLNFFWRLLLGERKSHVFSFTACSSWISVLLLLLKGLNQTIPLPLELVYHCNVFTPAPPKPVPRCTLSALPLHTNISRKSLKYLPFLLYARRVILQQAKLPPGVTSLPCAQCSWRLPALLHQLKPHFKGVHPP